MIRVGVVGCGYWGPKLIRNFTEIPGAEVVAVCDANAERLASLRLPSPFVLTTTDPGELIGMPTVDAVVVATPVSSHFELALQALRAGKHVLVEKPLATSSALGRRLIDEAARRNLVLMVDHTFVYTGAVRSIRQILDDGIVGDVLYYDSVRINLGLFQHDVNVLWDLAAHDLSIMDYLLPQRPCAVSATGVSHVAGRSENVAYITLFFDDNLIAHVHANWLSPIKIRQTLIGGSQKMIVYNDLEPIEKVKVYDKGIVVNDDLASIDRRHIGYRTGEMWAPGVDATEALRSEVLHFVQCINSSERPTSDGEAGVRVVEILEAATESIGAQGRPIELVERGALR